MAISFYCVPHTPFQKPTPIIKPLNKLLTLKQSQLDVKRSVPLQIRCCIKNKVFEDESEGIICYKTDSGEIICEGYDEGPRFQQQTTRTTYHPRDAEILHLLQQRYLQVVNGGEYVSNCVDKDLLQDLKWNDYNKFH